MPYTGPPDPERGLAKVMARLSFNTCLQSGAITIAWYGAIFATRRVVKHVAHRPAFTRWVKVQERTNDLTIPEFIGLFPAYTSVFFGLIGSIDYISYRSKLAEYNRYQKRKKSC